MKLYYAPGACSMASRITLNELDLEADYERVDLQSKRTERGTDFRAVNPLGYVPVLELDDGRILVENGAILPFLASLEPGRMAPAGDPLGAVELNHWLAFLSSELHKSFSPFFAGATGAERDQALAKLATRFDHVEAGLADGRDYLLGDAFTIADAYAFVILNWAASQAISLAAWPNVAAFVQRAGARASVRRALAEEGLTTAVAA